MKTNFLGGIPFAEGKSYLINMLEFLEGQRKYALWWPI